MATTKQVSLHGRKAYLTRNGRLNVVTGFASGDEDGPSMFYPAPSTVALLDDFISSQQGTGVADTGQAGIHFLAKCTDTGVKSAIADVPNGVLRITSSATITTPTPAGSSKSIVGKQLIWKAAQGKELDYGLRMSARVRASGFPTKTSGDWTGLFVGFTDTTAHEVPVYDTGGVVADTSPASDCVGFLWGTGGDTGFRGYSANSGLAGGAADSGDQQVTLTTDLPTANKWYDFEMQIRRDPNSATAPSTDYTCEFWIDGKYKGAIRNPVNQTVQLTPIVSFYDTGGAYVCDVDYINVSAPRDTGS